MSKVDDFKFTVVEERGDEVVIEVSEDDYREALAQGVDPEYALKPGRHTFERGGFLKRHPGFDPKSVEKKVRVSIYLDSDVLNYFKQRAAESGSSSYEDQINDALRGYIEQSSQPRDYSFLLEDEHFITAIAQRVAEQLRQNE